MRVLVRIALQNLLQGGRRVGFLAAALALAAFFLVVVTALFAGLEERLTDTGTALQSGDVNVCGFDRTSPTRMTPVVLDAGAIERLARERLPDLDYVAARHIWLVRVLSGSGAADAWFWGVDISREPRLRRTLEEALVRDDSTSSAVAPSIEALAKPDSLVLFASQAAKLNVRVGDKVAIVTRTFRGITNTADVTVVGIVRDLGGITDWTGFVNFTTLRELLMVPAESAGQVLLYLKDRQGAQASMLELRQALSSGGADVMPYRDVPSYTILEAAETQSWRGQRYFVNTWRDELADYTWRLTTVQAISLVLSIILIAVIGLGVTNSMLVAVQQRTREIGTLRSLGMSRVRLVVMFVLEGAVLGLVAAGAGGLAGAGAAALANVLSISVGSAAFRDLYLSDKLGFTVSASYVLFVALMFMLVAGAASIWPAVRAARLRPAAALRSTT